MTILKIFLALCVIIALAHIISAITIDNTVEYKAVPFFSSKVNPGLDGYTIAYVSDTHAMSVKKLEKVTEELNILKPDLLILGGDMTPNPRSPRRTIEILSKVQAPDGIYGVEGNHDDYKELFGVMEEFSMKPLSNSGEKVRDGLFIAGAEDLWNRAPDIRAAVKGSGPDDFVILASHNPDIVMERDTSGVDLVLSGHTHGGQITFFGLFAPALSMTRHVTSYGQRFMSGWAESPAGTPMYVSNGTGYYTQIPRIYARPQVILITLRNAEE